MTTPKRLYIGQPNTSVGTIYTVPTGSKVIVKNIIMTNTSINDGDVTVHFVSSGGVAGNDNKVLSNYLINGKDTVVIDVSAVLEEGDSIQALQQTSGVVTVYMSGVEV